MRNRVRNASTPIKAGDLLLSEQPFAFVLSSKEQGSRCDNCLHKLKVLKCSGCQFVHYCGRICQKEAWADHKWECINFKRVAPKVVPDGARMLAKVINRLNRGDGQSFRAFYTDTSFRMWKDLMSHYSDLKADKKRMDHFTSLSVVLYEFLNDISLPNAVELMGLYGRMVINSFMILDMDMNSIGTGIYLASSIIDHSCDPNAIVTFDGKTINIRAIRDMPSLDWSQIRISYIDLMKTPYERQTELLESYYFLCQCPRCLDGTQAKYVHAAKCRNSACDNPVSIPWKDICPVVRKIDMDNKKTLNNTKHNESDTNGVGNRKHENNLQNKKQCISDKNTFVDNNVQNNESEGIVQISKLDKVQSGKSNDSSNVQMSKLNDNKVQTKTQSNSETNTFDLKNVQRDESDSSNARNSNLGKRIQNDETDSSDVQDSNRDGIVKNGEDNKIVHNGDVQHRNIDLINNRNGSKQESDNNDVACGQCKTKFTKNDVETFIKAMEFTQETLKTMEGTSVAYVDVCNYSLQRHEGVLHPMNVLHAQTLDHAFDALIQMQLWEKACLYAERLIPCFKFYYGERNPLLGLLHMKYGKILLYKMDFEKCVNQLKCAEKIIRMTHGVSHPLYRDQLMPLLQQAVMESS